MPHQGSAADGVWNNAAGGNWSTTANWSSTVANGAGAVANFTNLNLLTANQTITLDTSITLGQLRLGDNNATDLRSYSFVASNGSTLTFDSGSATAHATIYQITTSNGDILNVPIVLNSSLDLINTGSKTLTISGNVSSGTAGLKTLNLIGAGLMVIPTANPFAAAANMGPTLISGVISDGAGQVAVNVDSPGAGTLTLSGANTFTGGVTLTSGTLILSSVNALGTGKLVINGGTLGSSAAARLQTANAPIDINQNFSFNSAQTLDIGNVSAVTLGRSITISTLNSQLSIYGNIGDGGNAYRLTKTGAGTLYLSAANTYTGGTEIDAGILVIGGTLSSFGGTGKNVLLQYGATASTTAVFSQSFLDRIDPNSVGIVGGWNSSSSGSNSLDLSGLANVRLGSGSGSVTYSGTITPYGSTFRIGGGPTTIVTSALTGAGRSLEIGIQGVSVGNVTLGGANTYDGITKILGAVTLTLTGTTGHIADTSNIVFTSNGTFTYDNTGATAAISETVGSLVLQAGDATVLSQRTANFNTALTFSSISRSAGATVNFNVTGTGSTTALNTVSIASAPTASSFINQGLFVSGANYAVYDTNGYIRAMSYGSDANSASVAGGTTLAAGSGKHVNLTGSITAQNTDTVQTLRLGGAYNVSLADGATLTLASGGILKTGNSAGTISGGTGITTGGAEFVIRTDVAGDTLTINSNILATSTGGLTKSGAGVLVLSGTNSYTGTTTLNAGTLRANGTGALSTGNIVINGGTLDLRANGTSPGNNNGTPELLSFGNNVTLAGDATIALNNTLASNTTYLNKFIGIGNLTLGGNTLTITNVTSGSNNNGYGLQVSGTTTLTASATGDTIFNLVTARPSNLTQALTFSGKVTGTSQITLKGAGTAAFTNASNDFVGNIRVTAGAVLSASNDGALGNAANSIYLIDSTSSSTFRATSTFSSSRTFVLGNNVGSVSNIFQVSNGETFTLNSAFSGGSGFMKSDNGTFEINADNGTWAGAVIIQDGVVKVSNSGALGSAAGYTQVDNSESALQLNGGSAGITIADTLYLDFTGVNSGGALESLAGSGVNHVTGAVILNGATSIGVDAGGVLSLDSTTAIVANAAASSTGLIPSNFALTLTGGGSGTLVAAIATGANTLTKLGAGTWTLTGASSFTGNAVINQGTLVLSGSQGSFANASNTVAISPGATLTLDNSNGHLDNRLNGRGVFLGGNLIIIGDASAATLETISGSNLKSGNTAGTVTLIANAGQSLTLQITGGSLTTGGKGTTLYRGTNLGSTPGVGVATIKASIAPTFTGQTSTAGSYNQGILAWALVDTTATGLGQGFATYDAIRGIRLLAASEQLGYFLVNANVALTAAKGVLASVSINSLNLGSGGGVTIQPLNTLTLQSGGLLAFAGNTGIHGGLLTTASNAELVIHALGDIEIGSVIAGTSGGLTKAEAGTLTLTASNLFTGATTINGGTLKLAGGDNTLLAGQAMNVNYGGTLDLGGTTQMVGALSSLGSANNEVPQDGGTITSSGGAATLVSNGGSSTFAGQITGSIAFAHSNTGTLALTGVNDYSGITLVNGGTLSLKDEGKITSSASFDINYAILRLDNTGLAADNDRVNDQADITLRGGTLSLFGRAGAFVSETVGKVTLAQGMNVISSADSSNNSNLSPEDATLILTSLQRNAAAGATVNFATQYTGTSAGFLGVLSSNTGTTERVLVQGGVPTVNNIIGGWAVVTNYFNYNALEFAGYDTAGGIGALNSSGFAGYDGTTLPITNQATQNIRTNTGGTVVAGGLNINSLNFIGDSATPTPVLNFANATDVLNLTSGGLAVSSNASITTFVPTIGSVQNEGRLTAGGVNPAAPADLFLFYLNPTAANALTVNSAVVDNPTNNQAVRLVVSGTNFGQFIVILASNQNSYTGGTVVNGEILQLGSAGSAANLVAGGLTLNGGTFNQVNGTIAAQDVTLNGSSTMTLVGNNTLNHLTFNNNGGNTATTLNVGTGTLTLGDSVTATSSNTAFTATIAGGTLALGASSRTFDVGLIQFNGKNISPDQASLNISSVISGSGQKLVKIGDGLLQLSGANTFDGGLDLQHGGIVISNSGALGGGTLTIGNQTVVTADGSGRVVSNAITLNGDFTMGVRGPTVAGALTFQGAVAWGSAVTHRLTVNSAPGVLQTISGQITGSGGIVKNGIGTLVLSANNSASLDWGGAGAVTVNNGTLSIANDNALGTAPATATAGNIVLNGGALSASATMTLNSNRGIALGDAAGSGTGNIDVASGTTLTYGGTVADNGSGADNLEKTGTGTLTFTAVNTYSGSTTVGAGTLVLGAGGAIDNSAKITVVTGATYNVSAVTNGYQLKSGQTLEGGGTVTGNTTINSGAVLAPGTGVNHTAELLTFSNNLTLAAGSTLQIQISVASFTSPDNFGGNAVGSDGYNTYIFNHSTGQGENDQIKVTGTLTQATGAHIVVTGNNFTAVNGEIFNILDWTTAFNASTNLGALQRDGSNDSGTDLDLPDISASGLYWDLSHFADYGVIVVAPEPGRACLLLLACLGFVLRRRRNAALRL